VGLIGFDALNRNQPHSIINNHSPNFQWQQKCLLAPAPIPPELRWSISLSKTTIAAVLAANDEAQ
jgi:hypothetical protein